MSFSKPAAAFLFLMLLISSCFANWAQNVVVKVSDSQGNPAEGVDVSITYQSSSALANDKITGRTGPDGIFSTLLSNTLAPAYESRAFEARASSYYWNGESKKANASDTGTTTFAFIVPQKLVPFIVSVYNSGKEPMQGALIFLNEQRTRRFTDRNGTALFYVPGGIPFTGFMTNANKTEYFSSSDSKETNGTMRLDITIPLSQILQTGEKAELGKTFLEARFMGLDNSPLANQKVALSYNGMTSSFFTDSDGKYTLILDKNGTVDFTVSKNDYPYRFAYNVTVVKNESKKAKEEYAIFPLLNITSFEKTEEGKGCYWLSAGVSDPRTNLPLTVEMSKTIWLANSDTPVTSSLPVSVDDDGMYVTDVMCISSNVEFKVIASNKYEKAEEAIRVISSQPKPEVVPDIPVPNLSANLSNSTNVTNTGPDIKGDEALLSIFVLFVVLGAAAIFMMRKQMLDYLLNTGARSVIKYVRETARILKLVKKEDQ